MNKIRKWLISVIIFLLIGIILFLNISEVLRKKTWNASDMIHSFYKIEKNTLDVICMGSSHGYSSFQPNTLWSEYGITSYLLGCDNQSIPSAYYLLKEALKYQKPKILLLESYYFHSDKKYLSEAVLRKGFDGMRLDEVKWQMVHDFLCDSSLKDQLSFYFPFLKYHSRWDELHDYDFHTKDYLKGSIFSTKISPVKESELPKEGSEISDTVYEYFEKIIRLCEENDVRLILYTAPYGYTDEKSREGYMERQGINITLESYLAEKNIPYIYLQKGNMAGIDYSTDFRNHTHMNTIGAIRVTQYLGKYMNEKFTLPDHRQDEAYQSWWTDYYAFQKDLEKALEKKNEK